MSLRDFLNHPKTLKFLDSNLCVWIVIGIALAIAMIPLVIKLHFIIKYW